jgi:hypothetical protein
LVVPSLPGPLDLIVRGLVFVGVPVAIFVPLYVTVWVLGWFRFARTARETAVAASRSGMVAARSIAQAAWTKRLAVVLAAAVLPAAAYATARLRTALDTSGLSSYSSGSIKHDYLMLINYSAHDPTAQAAFLVALGWVSTLAIASVVGANAIRDLLAFALGFVAVVVGVIAAGAVLAEIAEIFLTVSHSGSNAELVVLGCAVMCGAGVAGGSRVILKAFP